MYMITINENNAVIDSIEVTYLPRLTPLEISNGERKMFSSGPAEIGTLFNESDKSFSPAPRKRWLTKLAFDSRFTMEEAIALKMAQSLSPKQTDETDQEYAIRSTIAASLQVLQSRLNMASYIDLERDDTRNGVLSLESMGLLGSGRSIEILDGEIADDEYYPTA